MQFRGSLDGVKYLGVGWLEVPVLIRWVGWSGGATAYLVGEDEFKNKTNLSQSWS